MAWSAPMLKRPMPRISITAPMVKVTSSVRVRFISGVRASRYTAAVMGKTDIRASLIFSCSSFKGAFLLLGIIDIIISENPKKSNPLKSNIL